DCTYHFTLTEDMHSGRHNPEQGEILLKSADNKTDSGTAEKLSFSGKRAFSWFTAAGLAIGVALLVYVLRKYHFREILAAVAAAGWGILWISLFRFVTIATDTAGWRELWLPPRKPPATSLFVFRWIG